MTPHEPGFVSLETMDAIFGPGWRTPYCLWPRGRSAVVDQGLVQGSDTTEHRPDPYLHKPAKPEIRQLQLGDHLVPVTSQVKSPPKLESYSARLDLARDIKAATQKEDAA